MKIRTSLPVSFGLLSALVAPPLAAGDLHVENDALQKALRLPISIRRVDEPATATAATAFAGFAGQAIEIEKARLRASTRLKRITYAQQRDRDVPLLLDGQVARRAARTLPAKVWFRQGPLYQALLKEKETSPQAPMPHRLLVARATRFIGDHGLVETTGRDRFAKPNITTRYISEDGGEDGRSFDYVVQQDVAFTRFVDGRPVINSQITIGVVADANEVVKVLVRNWPVLSSKEVSGIKPHIRDLDAKTVVEEVAGSLRRTAGEFASARVRELFACWYQTEEYLLPAIAFVVDLQFDDGRRDHVQVELFNPISGSRMFREATELSERPTYPWE